MKMQRNVPVRKAFGPESTVQRVLLYRPAVHGQKYTPSVRILTKRHIVSQPAFHPSALVIIAPGTFLGELTAMAEAIHIEGTEVYADPAEILDQFAVSHTVCPRRSRYDWKTALHVFLPSQGFSLIC